jgi:hypothetical protein
MKILMTLAIACGALAGCVAVPVEPAPVVYAAPPPAVVVRPLPYYRHHHHHYYGSGRYWRRWRY